MIAAQPTQQELQSLWEREPLVFHTAPMPGFEEQGLSAAQWGLLTQATWSFWKDKTPPQESFLWGWATENIKDSTAALDLLARMQVPVQADTLVGLLLRSAGGNDKKMALPVLEFAASHPLAWSTEKDKAVAPELLASPHNVGFLTLLDSNPGLLQWKKASTGNGLLHNAVLYKSRASISALIAKGASQEANNEGLTPQQLAKEQSVVWPSTFGKAPMAVPSPSATQANLNSVPPKQKGAKPAKDSGASSDQMSLF